MSINNSQAEAFQGYVRTFQEDLFTEMFTGYQTADLAQIFEGIKGEHILTQLEIGENLARRWGKDFEPVADAATTKPRTLKTVLNKVDFSVVPQEFEKSYLGMLRKKGQDPTDFPFQQYVMDKVIAKLLTEFEVADWQAVEEASPAAGDYLRQTYDGYLQIIKDAITATTITPVSTGAVTSANIIAKLRDMWETVAVPYKLNGTDIFMSYAQYDNYRKAYKDAYKIDVAYTEISAAGYKGVQYEMGNGNTSIIPVAGMGSSNRIVITPRENLALGIDDPADVMFNVAQDTRTLKFWMDFRKGAQILMQKDGILVVNDQE